MGDQDLLAMYHARNPAATDAMQQQYGAYCTEIVSRILPDIRDQEECLNDVWLRIWNALAHQYPQNLKGWIGTVTRNCALSHYHRQGSAHCPLEECANELSAPLHHTPAAHMESKLLGETISSFLHTQPQHVRIAFVRRYWYGDSMDAVAKHMGWSVSKTKTTLYRTRCKLKDYLLKEGLYHG